MYSATWNIFNSNNVSLSGIVLSVLSMFKQLMIVDEKNDNDTEEDKVH